MKCITRYDLKFGDLIVPARTECIVINTPKAYTVDAPGVQLNVVIYNHDLKIPNTDNENEVIKYRSNVNRASLDGILIHTNTESVYMDAGDYVYKDYGLYDWQLEKIFGKDNIPEGLIIGKHEYNGKDAKLSAVVDYLDEEFADWVGENCDFITLTEDDLKNCDFYDFEIGDTVLSEVGLQQFEEKCLEYKKKLETTGFTYDFKGGLNWS